MIQELYQAAMKIAGEKHSNQKVPGTISNYLLDISNVAMEVLMADSFDKGFDINFAIQTAILHDTIEDTSADYTEIEDKFGERIANAVQALSKNEELPPKKERMIDSLNRVNQLEKEVGLVKIADRITNLQTPPKHWGNDKISNYLEEAKLIVEFLADKNEYLISRLREKILAYETNKK